MGFGKPFKTPTHSSWEGGSRRGKKPKPPPAPQPPSTIPTNPAAAATKYVRMVAALYCMVAPLYYMVAALCTAWLLHCVLHGCCTAYCMVAADRSDANHPCISVTRVLCAVSHFISLADTCCGCAGVTTRTTRTTRTVYLRISPVCRYDDSQWSVSRNPLSNQQSSSDLSAR